MQKKLTLQRSSSMAYIGQEGAIPRPNSRKNRPSNKGSLPGASPDLKSTDRAELGVDHTRARSIISLLVFRPADKACFVVPERDNRISLRNLQNGSLAPANERRQNRESLIKRCLYARSNPW